MSGKVQIVVTGSEPDVNEAVSRLRTCGIDAWKIGDAPPAAPSRRRPTRMSAFYDGLVVGVLGLFAWTSLRQDYLGLDGYIATARAGWGDWRYTVPLALVALAACVVVGVGTIRRARQADAAETQ